ncbi:hypothetical protein [Candidatus Amarobacter glycogenicus]|uniref:hypothetical protein n=1 Tax=Candidatus Amarobacter glycogenicus TaxID=3140699 RepID=UPI0031348253|nr:hypothetical protein [Dehalococcoidia bacterium]
MTCFTPGSAPGQSAAEAIRQQFGDDDVRMGPAKPGAQATAMLAAGRSSGSPLWMERRIERLPG